MNRRIDQPVLIDAHSSDVDDIRNWKPADPNEASQWVALTIGPDETGGDYFQAHFCTPALAQGLEDKHGLVIVPYYENWDSVLEALDKVLEQCRGNHWWDMREKLSRRLIWEYANRK